MKEQNAVNEAIERFGYAALAARFPSNAETRETLTPQAIRKWAIHGVPAKRVLEFERVTGIPKERIRPDLYPPEVAAA